MAVESPVDKASVLRIKVHHHFSDFLHSNILGESASMPVPSTAREAIWNQSEAVWGPGEPRVASPAFPRTVASARQEFDLG